MALVWICDVATCPRCYLDELTTSEAPRLRQRAEIELRYVEGAHRVMALRKRGRTR